MRSYCGFSQIHDEKLFVESCGGGGAAGVDAEALAAGGAAEVEGEGEADVADEVAGEGDAVDLAVDVGLVTSEAAPQATSVVKVTMGPRRERRCCDIPLAMA